MTKLFKLHISMFIVLATICSVYLFNLFTVPAAFALDINKMAGSELEKEKEPEMPELNKEFFFETLEKRFNEVLEEYNGEINIIAYVHSDGDIFGTLTTPSLGQGYLIYAVLHNSYGVYPEYSYKYRDNYRNPIQGTSYVVLFSTLEYIAQYHAAVNGYPFYEGANPKALEKYIHEGVIVIPKFLDEDAPTTKAPATENDKKGIINFISDYDKFIDKYYTAYANKTNIAKKKEANEKEVYEKKIKSGKLPIKSKEDAIIYYSPEDGSSIVTKPPLKGDNKYYIVRGKLERVEGDQYIVYSSQVFDAGYFTFELTSKGKAYNPGFRIGKYLTIVGKFVGTMSYTTVSGATKYAAVFDADFVELQ